MAKTSRLTVTYASDVQRDGFFAEFSCEGAQWGELAFDPTSDSYRGAYTLTIYGSQAGSPWVLDVAELEELLQVAKWRVTPLAREHE